jgi:hypothetical protein
VIISKKHVTPQIQLNALDRDFSRADIEFDGVDHGGASFEARIFLNNPEADEHTEKSSETGYAGSFHIFGHGGCFGDDGHCDITPRRAYDPRPAHPLSPARKIVIATEAVRRTLQRGDTTTVTIIPIVTSLNEKCTTEDVLRFDNVRIVTYR